MTLAEAKKIAGTTANERWTFGESAVHSACVVLADALRAAEGQVAHLNAKLDATHTNRCFNCEQTVTRATTARQAEVAALRDDLLSPPPAVAPVDLCPDCRGMGGFDKYGKPADPSVHRDSESCGGTGSVAPE